MPKKRHESPLVELVRDGRWPIAATMSALWLVVGMIVVPRMLASSIYFRGLTPTIRAISLVGAIALAGIAFFKFLRERSGGQSPKTPRARLSIVEPSTRRPQVVDPDDPDKRVDPVRAESSIGLKPTEWSLALLQSIEWKRFEEVVAAYFRARNFRCETIAFGPDGGVDGRLYFGDLPDAVGIVQCKAWSNKLVGVAPVRELLGAMTHEKVSRGYFCATGEFSKEALAFAEANPIKLISGPALLEGIAQMPAEARQHLLEVSTTGDYTTPTCPSCGIKLVERTIGGKKAWGCRHFPRCRTTIFRKNDHDKRGYAGHLFSATEA